MILDTIIGAFKLMNLPVYSGTIFSCFFTDQNLTPVVKKMAASMNDDNNFDTSIDLSLSDYKSKLLSLNPLPNNPWFLRP